MLNPRKAYQTASRICLIGMGVDFADTNRFVHPTRHRYGQQAINCLPTFFKSLSPQMLASPDLPRPFKKREKVVLDKWANLTACDICRSRKVKCVRLDENSKDCAACKSRDEHCHNTIKGTGKIVRRERKATHTVASSTSSHVAPISHHSPEAGLQRIELSDAFMAELLASFFQHSDEQAPYTNYGIIQAKFDQAGRRLNQLDPVVEPLILAMIASSAQYSDSYMLLGSNAPRLKYLRSLRDGTDLSQFGHRRQVLCAQLARKVVELTDVRGLFRKPSSQAISVLTMIPRVLRHPLPWKGLEDIGDTWRPFMSAAFSHIRTLIELHGVDNVDIGIVKWPMVISDACNSAFHGCSLLVTDDDLVDFSMSGLPLPSPEMARKYLLSNDIKQSIFPLLASANATIMIGRKISKTISIPLQKKRNVELSIFSERIQDVSKHLQTLRECGYIAEDIEPFISPTFLEAQKQAFGASMPTYMKLAPVTPTILMPALHKQFELYKQQRRPITLLDDSDLMEIANRERVQRELELGLLDSIFIVADAIRGLEGKEIVASLTRQTSLLVSIQERVLLYFRLACDIRTTEQHGVSSEWSHDVKSQTLRLLLDAAQLQAWSWGDRQADLATCEQQYRQYIDSLYYPPPHLEFDFDALCDQGTPDMFATTSNHSSQSNPAGYSSAGSAGFSDPLFGNVVTNPGAWSTDYPEFWIGNDFI